MPPTSSRHVRFAPKGGKFLLVAQDDNLPKGRRLVATAPVTLTDAGDGGDFTIAVDGATGSIRGILKLAGQIGGSADAPDVRGVRVNPSSTPVLLTIGAVADGQVLGRSGTALVGVSALSSGGGTLSGDLAMGGYKVTGLGSGSATGDAATYGQLTSMLNGLDWQKSVASAITTPPGSPATGDRYLIVATAAGAWAGHEEKIAEWNGTSWALTVPNKGYTVHNEANGEDLTYNGAHPSGSWVNIGASVDHASLLNLATGNPHTQYQLSSGREAADGYAGLGADGLPIKPTKGVRIGADPGTPAPGEIWVVGADLKYRNDVGSPATEVAERVSRRNAANGYAGVGGDSRVDAAQAPAKAVYATGGGQALTPADIGAVAPSRAVASGVGLAGGGALSADRTLSIATFAGFLSKDVDPASQTYPASSSVVHATYDVGADGMLVPTGVRLPATVDAGLVTELVFEYQDASTRTITNTNTGAHLDDALQGMANFCMGDVSMAADSNGHAIRKIILRTRNTTGSDIPGINIGVFRIRALALPRGGGAAL